MNKRTIIIIIILILAVIIGIRIFKGGKDEGDKKAKGGDFKKAIPVDVYLVQPGKLENRINLTGTLIASEQTELRNEVPGRITGLWLSEGQAVKKGQLLLKINDKELQAQLKKVRLQEKLAGTELDRKKKLLDIKGISQEEYDQAENTLLTLQAEAELLEAQIEKTEVRAPFNGILGLRNVSEGAYLGSSTVITTIQMLDPVRIEFTVPEKYLGGISTGSRISFVPEGNHKTYEAAIYAIDPHIDPGTRTARIRALCGNDGRLIPGGFLNVELLLNKADSALLIPAEALVPQIKGQGVYVIRNGKAIMTPVVTGIRNDNEVEIVEGIQSGDSIAVSGLMQLKNESAVVIKSVKSR